VKILNVFSHYLERGGEEVAVEEICQSLSEVTEVERCDFFSSSWTGPSAPAMWKQALGMLWNPQSLKEIREHHRRFRPDAWLVHNVFPVGSAAIYREAASIGTPIVQYVHNFRPFSVNGYLWAANRLAVGGLSRDYWTEIRHGAWQNSRLRTAWLAFTLSIMHALGWWNSVKVWIAVSDFVRQKFIAAGIPAAKIFSLHYFWKPEPRQPISEGAHYLFLGRLIEAKGILILLDAWEILERECGSAAPKLLIGGDGPLRSLVEARVERMRCVRFAGHLGGDDKRDALARCRAMIVPSLWWEALGLVVYEAYEFSRPVLAASSGGLTEVVIPGETGLLHEAGNAAEIAHQVRQMEANVTDRHTLGQQGRKWLEQNANEAEWREKFFKIASYALDATPR